MRKKIQIMATVLLLAGLITGSGTAESGAEKIIRKKFKTKNYTMEVSYPVFGKEKILNEKIKKIVKQEMENFKKGLTDHEKIESEENEIPKSYLEINSETLEKSQNLISVAIYVGAYDQGAAHPNTWTISVNYDKKRKKIMTFGDMFLPGTDFIKTISEKAIEKLKKEELLAENEDWLMEGAGPDEKNFMVFNLTRNALVLTFDPYKIAPYSQGKFRAEIPLMELREVVKPEFLMHQIKKEVSKIEKNLKSYSKKTKDLSESTEGGAFDGYFKEREIKKIQAEYFGETGKNLQKYYFFDETLIYFEEKNTTYNKSISALTEGEELKSITKTKKYYPPFEKSVPEKAQKLLESLESDLF